MADKTYRMTVKLSNGNTVDAGTFVAPQGPQGMRGVTGPRGPEGPQGPEGQQGASGAINDWAINQDPNSTTLSDGTYLIRIRSENLPSGGGLLTGIVDIANGNSPGVVLGGITTGSDVSLSLFMILIVGGKIVVGFRFIIGENTYTREEISISSFDYIKLK